MKPTKAELKYRRWVALEHPCLGCKIEDDTRIAHHLTFIKSESSMGGKASERFLVPLCHICHMEKLHRHSEKKFWRDCKVTLDEVIQEANELYLEYHLEGI